MDDGSGGHVLIYTSSIQESGGWGGGTNEMNYLPVEIPMNGFSSGEPVSASDLWSGGGSSGGVVTRATAKLWVHPDGTIYAHEYTARQRFYH
jgi:hypothetical protein